MLSLLLDTLALILYTLCLGAIVGGGLMALRLRGWGRLSGLLLIIESLALGGLLTLMSSKYWLDGEGLIEIGLMPLVSTTASTIIAIAIGGVVTLGIGHQVMRLARGSHRVLGVFAPLLLLLVGLTSGGAGLVILSEPIKAKTEVRDPQKGTIAIVPGFAVTIYSQTRVHFPTGMAIGPNDSLYVCDYNGYIWRIADDNHDHLGDPPVLYAQGFKEPTGIAWRGHDLYVASRGQISILRDRDGNGTVDENRAIVTGLPAGLYPWHQNQSITFGPDGRLYFAVGSTSNMAPEQYRYGASILSVAPDGSDIRTVATGVRNAFDLAFNASGDLFATDNGPDGLAETPGEELNHIVQDSDYGFPRHFGQPPIGSNTHGPVFIFPPHTSADGIVFYNGKLFPREYHDNAFITLWNNGEIYRVQLAKTDDGTYLARGTVFASGFMHPLDIIVGRDESLYVADFATGAIYRISASAPVVYAP